MFTPLIVIPLFNHGSTVKAVAVDALASGYKVLVVDDGSTDGGAAALNDLPVELLRHERNQGKGGAILSAVDWGKERGFTHILTIDADGQHYMADALKLIEKGQVNPQSIIIGKRDFNTENVPRSSKFGRNFSAFWARVQTGQTVRDIQSGLRLYPLVVFDCIKFREYRYSFEIEVIIKALWAGFPVEEIEVNVFYPKRENRISHFKALRDNLLISLLNTKLTLRSALPWPHQKVILSKDNEVQVQTPFKTVWQQMQSDEAPWLMGVSAAWGIFCGSIGLPFVGTMLLMLGAGWFNLNRAISFSVEKLAIPPLVPAICIEVGYYLRHGEWLTDIGWRTLGLQFLQRFWEWILGSLVVAPSLAVVMGIVFYVLGYLTKKGLIYGAKMVR